MNALHATSLLCITMITYHVLATDAHDIFIHLRYSVSRIQSAQSDTARGTCSQVTHAMFLFSQPIFAQVTPD